MDSMKFYLSLTSLFVLYIQSCKSSRYIPIIDENYEDCGHSGYIDFKGLEFYTLNDSHTALNGKVVFKKEIHSPWIVKVSSQRFDRGQWHMGEVNRRIADLCLVLQDSVEPWYPITSKLKQKSCPFPAGTVAEFNMLPMIGFNIEIPSSFTGKWKIRIDMVFKDLPGMEKEEECIDVKFDIMEF